MHRITVIEFNPQDRDDTLDAITDAKTIIDAAGVVRLSPSSNLIHYDCLYLLDSRGFSASVQGYFYYKPTRGATK